MTVKEILSELRGSLSAVVGDSEARAMAEIIVEDTTGRSRTAMLLNPEATLTPESVAHIRRIKQKVIDGMPVQYAIGRAMFRGRMFKVAPGVLIPRPETAQLVDMIVDQNHQRSDLRILDIGCGSGCIAISLARDLPFSRVTAMDFSPAAIEITGQNAQALGAKINIVQADVLDYRSTLPGTGHYDIVVSNPPYILPKEAADMDSRVLDHEPQEAIFVPDNDPLVFYRTIAKKAWTKLDKNGRIYFEINAMCAAKMKALMSDIGYTDVEIIRDYCGAYRFLSCTLP